MFVDNGTPWGDGWTRLGVWLLKLGVEILHSRSYRPQSRGKNERFHRTLAAEVFALRRFRDRAQVQHACDGWREVYNFERPHEALGQDVPASRYRPSPRSMPERLPVPEYDAHEIVRTVSMCRKLSAASVSPSARSTATVPGASSLPSTTSPLST